MVVALDVETSESPKHFPWVEGSYLSLVVAIELLDTGNQVVHSWVFNHNSVGLRPQRQMLDEIQNLLNRADLLIAHNAKFDLHWLRSMGLKTPHVHDTMVCEYLIIGQNNQINISLDETAKRYGLSPKLDAVKEYWKSGISTANIPLDTLTEYCVHDTQLTLDLYHLQLPKLQELGLVKLAKLHNYFVECLQEIEANGMKVDVAFLQKSKAEYKERLDTLKVELQMFIQDYFSTDFVFNLSSNDHLSVILYGGTLPVDFKEQYTTTLKSGEVKHKERWSTYDVTFKGLGFKPNAKDECKKKGFYKTNKSVLATLNAKTKAQQHFLEFIQEMSGVEKIYTTYLEGMEKHIRAGDIIHPSFNQAFTVTGRLSSSQPNFQNLPRGGTDSVAKRLFIPKGTDRVIVNGDASALEWVVGAQLSGDPVMIQEIIDGTDIHTANSIAIFGSDAFRQASKTVSFRSLN